MNNINKAPFSRNKTRSFNKQYNQYKNNTQLELNPNYKNNKPNKVIQFSPANNSKLNEIYKKFINKNKTSIQYLNTQQQKFESDYQHKKRIQRIATLNSTQQNPKKTYNINKNYIDLKQQKSQACRIDSPHSTFKQPISVVIKINNQQQLKKKMLQRKSMKQASVQVDKMKIRFQAIIFQNFENIQQKLIGKLKQVNNKVIGSQQKISKLIGFIIKLSHLLNSMRYKVKQNYILKQLNQQLQSKLSNLYTEHKNNKELQILKETVIKAKQNNLIRQQRASTPNKQRLEIQKKVLIKQNLELKKKYQQLQKQYFKKDQQYECIYKEYIKMKDYTKSIQNQNFSIEQKFQKSQIYVELIKQIQQLQKKIDKTEYNKEKLTKLQQIQRKMELMEFQSQRKQSQLKQYAQTIQLIRVNNLKKQDQIRNLKQQIKQIKQQSQEQSQKIRKVMEQQRIDIRRLTSRQNEYRKQLNDYKKYKENDEQEGRLFKRQKYINKTTNQKQIYKREEQLINLRVQNDKLRKQIYNLKCQNEQGNKKIENCHEQIELIIKNLKKILKSQSIRYQSNSIQLNKIYVSLIDKLQNYQQKINQLQLDNKKFAIHKNKMDHILYEQNNIEYNQFQTTQYDPYYFGSNTNVVQQLKKTGIQLQKQLEQNIRLRNEVFRSKKKIQQLNERIRKIRQGIYRGLKSQNKKQIILNSLLMVVNEQKQQVKK